jgi:hypothetical protein
VRAASRADAKGNITAKSDNVRQVLDYARRLAPFLPPDVAQLPPICGAAADKTGAKRLMDG